MAHFEWKVCHERRSVSHRQTVDQLAHLFLKGYSSTVSVTLEIPSEVVDSVRVPPQEVEARLRLELAVALYAQNLLSGGKAATLAGIDRWQWEDVLASRHIERHYDDDAVTDDLAYGQGRR